MFLDQPLTALAVAGAAAAVPIVLHLLRRARYQVVDFAAMRFLQAIHQRDRRKLRLEQAALLFVRIAMVLALIGAMASVTPWAQELWNRWLAAGAVTARGPIRAHRIFVIDGSFSMSRRIGNETAFSRAQSLAQKIVMSHAGADGFSLLLMAQDPRRIIPHAAEDPARVSAEIQALRLPHGNADVPAACRAVEDLVRQSPEKYQDRVIYFFTDLQRATWETAIPASLADSMKQRPAQIVMIDVGAENTDNLAVSRLSVPAALPITGTPVSILASIHNHGVAVQRGVTVELWASRAGKSNEASSSGMIGRSRIDADAGRITNAAFSHTFSEPGEYILQARLPTDALELDNQRSIVLTVKDDVPILLVDGNPAVKAYQGATDWLRDALNPFDEITNPRASPLRPRSIPAQRFEENTSRALESCATVFICDVPQVAESTVHALEDHLRRGGGVVLCLGPHVDLEAYNRVLYRDGRGILPARLVGIEKAPGGYTFSAPDDSFREAPLGVFSADRDRVALFTARFQQFVRVAVPPRSGGRRILSFVPSYIPSSGTLPARESPSTAGDGAERGHPALVVWPRLRGRVALLTTTVNRDWNSWPLSPCFAPLMQELLLVMASGLTSGQSAAVGETLEFSSSHAGQFTVETPSGQRLEGHTEDRQGTPWVDWQETDESGVYRFTIGGEPQRARAVNVPAETSSGRSESELQRIAPERLRQLFAGTDLQIAADSESIRETGTAQHSVPPFADSAGSRIASWLLFGSLLLNLLEMILIWRSTRHISPDSEPETPGIAPWALAAIAAVAAGILIVVVCQARGGNDFSRLLPLGLRNIFERSLEIPVPDPGETTEWHIETLFAPSSRWLYWLVLVVAGVLLLTILRAERPLSGRASGMLRCAFRAGFIAMVAAIFLPQFQLYFDRQTWPDIAIVIDDSKSMSTRDHYREPNDRAVATALHSGPSSPSRLEIVQSLLASGPKPWLAELLHAHQARVHVYRASSGLIHVADLGEHAASLDDVTLRLSRLRPLGESSRLGSALRQVLMDFRGQPLCAVIMMTDGITTEGEDLSQAAVYAARMGVPCFFVGLGDAASKPELRLIDLQSAESISLGDRLVFEARLGNRGLPGARVQVTLREKNKEGVLAAQSIQLDEGQTEKNVRLGYEPGQSGTVTYVIEAVTADADHRAVRAQIERTIQVRQADRIRVLIVDGSARWEFRYLKSLLEREGRGKERQFDLQVLLLDADPDFVREDRSAISELPTPSELSRFDVIVLGDVDPRDPRLERRLPEFADFVRKRGGGLLFLAGAAHNPRDFLATALGDVMPIEAASAGGTDSEEASAFKPVQTLAGQHHPILRFHADEMANASAWARLPPWYWWSRQLRARPGAETLLEHPVDPQGSATLAEPIVVGQLIGAGKCLFLGTDEFWRWRFRDDLAYYNHFWLESIRYLARDSSRQTELRLDRQTPYRQGEPIKIMVHLSDDSPRPGDLTNWRIAVDRRPPGSADRQPGERDSVPLERVEKAPGDLMAILDRTPEGRYCFALSAPLSGTPPAEVMCEVLPPPGEMDRLDVDKATLQRASALTNGRAYCLATCNQLFADLPAGTRVTLPSPQPPRAIWSHPALFGFAVFLLFSEWWMRKRFHLV